MKAMILAAGLGTRLQPFTNHHPKALAPIGNHTLLELAIKKIKAAGIHEIVVNVHHFAEQIIQYLEKNENFGATISVSDESDEVLETGGGVKKAVETFDITDDLLVCNADILSNINLHLLVNYHKEMKADATLAVQQRNSSRQLLFNENNLLTAWTNVQDKSYKPIGYKPNSSDQLFAFSGIQIIKTKLVREAPLSGKFSLIDLYLSTKDANKIIAYHHSADILLDVGKPEAHQQAQALLKEIL